MAKINIDGDLNVSRKSGLVTEITTIANNKFIRRLYVGVPYKKAIKHFEEAIKKGNI